MIIKSISAENFGKFDRYSVNLDESINVFFGDNEAGKTTLYEIISILLFAPVTEEDMAESNKLIKSDEKYARVYAIINLEGKEISVAREIYQNDTNLSIADQENVSSLGNVNVPFIGDLSKEMYESFHTIDFYSMATITKNVWQQILEVIEESHGAPRITPDYSTPEEEKVEKKKATFEEDIKAKEKELSNLKSSLKDAQKKQKRMIKNQDKIDDLISDLEDIDNNIELETSYLKEADRMNQIRTTIKKTQDLSLELKQYKNLSPWMPNLREYYNRLKLYTENKADGIENPLDMFDDLDGIVKPEEEKKAEVKEVKKEAWAPKAKEVKEEIPAAETKQEEKAPAKAEETPPATEETIDAPVVKEEAKEVKAQAEDKSAGIESKKEEAPSVLEEIKQAIKPEAEPVKEEQKQPEIIEPVPVEHKQVKSEFPSDNDYDASKEKINKFIEDSYLNFGFKADKNAQDPYEDEMDEEEMLNQAASMFVTQNIAEAEKQNAENTDISVEVKPLEIRKPKDMKPDNDDAEEVGATNRFGQRNPYSDNLYPDMDKVKYSDDLSKIEIDIDSDDDDDDDKYSLSTFNNIPTQTKKVSENDMNSNDNENNKKEKSYDEKITEAENFLNNVDMQEVINASKQEVIVDNETKEEIDKAQLRYKVIAKRVFSNDMDMDDLSAKLKKVDTNSIYKTIVKYKGLSQKQRKLEHDLVKVESKSSSGGGVSIGLIIAASLSLLLGLACFFIDMIISYFPNSSVLNFIYNEILMGLNRGLPIDFIPGNMFAGGALVIISILLLVVIILGIEKPQPSEQLVVDDVEMDEIKNNIRTAKREVIDALNGFPLPHSYLDNPNNTIITVINELREAEGAYNDLVLESKMPPNQSYRALWKLSKSILEPHELSDDLFENISKMRRKIQDHKDEKAEKENKLRQAKMGINLVSEKSHSSQSFNQFTPGGSLGGFTPPKKDNAAASSSVGLPKFESKAQNNNDIGMKSESSSFALPQTNMGSTDVDNAKTIMPEFNSFNSVSEQSFEPSAPSQDSGYSNDGMFAAEKDTSYPGGGMFGEEKDTSYPGGGGTFGETKDANNLKDTFGSATGSEYSFANPSDKANTAQESKDNSFSIPGVNHYGSVTAQNENKDEFDAVTIQPEFDNIDKPKSDNPFAIPGVNKYSEDSPFEQSKSYESNPFAAVKESKEDDDIVFGQATMGGENPFGQPDANDSVLPAQHSKQDENNEFAIPGINKFDANAPSIPKEAKEDNSFGIPGIKHYGMDTPSMTGQSDKQDNFSMPDTKTDFGSASMDSSNAKDESDPFGIPGIKRYSYEPTKNEQETKTEFKMPDSNKSQEEFKPEGIQSGLPGLDKFSNRNKQEAKKTSDTPKDDNDVMAAAVPITEAAASSETVAASAAGAVVSAATGGGLPGLDKFSNRGKQEKTEDKTEENEIKEQSMEADPFSIPKLNDKKEAEETTAETQEELKEEITQVEEAEQKAEDKQEPEKAEEAAEAEEKKRRSKRS